MLGATAAGLWLLLGMFEAIWLVRTARPGPPNLVEQLRAAAGNSAPSTRLLLSNHVHNAVALGIWQPAILLPTALAEHAEEKSLRAVLAHEAAHIANRDLWLLGLMRGLMVVLFPHPLYWMIRRVIRNSQEALADAVAAQSRETDYAEGLVEWMRHSAKPRQILAANAVGIWERPLDLSRRISLLLDENFSVQTRLPRGWRLGVAVCAGTIALGLSLFTVRPASAGSLRHAEMLAAGSLTPGSGRQMPADNNAAIYLKGVSEYRSFETNGALLDRETEDIELFRQGCAWRMVFKNAKWEFAPPQPTDLPPPDSPQAMMEILRTNRHARFRHKPMPSVVGDVSEVADDGTNVYLVTRNYVGKIRLDIEKTNLTEYYNHASIYASCDSLPLRHGVSLVFLFETAFVTNTRAAHELGDITLLASSPHGVDYTCRIENDLAKNSFGPSALDIYLGKTTNAFKAPAATLVIDKSEIHNGLAIPTQAKFTACHVLERNADGTPIPLYSYEIRVDTAQVLNGPCQIAPPLGKPTMINDRRNNSCYVSDSWPTMGGERPQSRGLK